MIELDVEPFALVGGLKLIIAQRLVRALRPEFSRSPTKEEAAKMPEAIRDTARVASAPGPKSFSSYHQRILLAEALPVSAALRQAIMEKAPLERFKQIAAEEGVDLPTTPPTARARRASPTRPPTIY